MKNYPLVDLTGDKYLNPDALVWNDNEGSHARNVGQITSISVHHDATFRPHDYDSVGRYHAEAAEHYQRLGYGLQYHFKIDNQGTIYFIRPLTTWLNCTGSSENVSTLAICLDGNFEIQQPTREQFEALYELLLSLCTQHPEFPATWQNVRPHADFSPTACCGANLRNRVYAIESEQTAQAQLLNVGDYDWPSMQPGFVQAAPPTTPPAPDHSAPTPPPAPLVQVTVTPPPPPAPAGEQDGALQVAVPTPEPAPVPASEPTVVRDSAPAEPAASDTKPASGLEVTPLTGSATLDQPRVIFDLETHKPVGIVAANVLNPKVLQIAGSVAADGMTWLLTPNMVAAAHASEPVLHGIKATDFVDQTTTQEAVKPEGFWRKLWNLFFNRKGKG